ncbi:MAG: ATP-binding protein [Patescibacteria group bacterium]
MEQEQLNQIVQDFLSRLSLPETKADKPFVVAMIGLIGSGRTMVAKMFVEKLKGAVLIKSDSARYLLKEADLPWGDNVRQILKGVATDLLNREYGVVFDGNATDEEDRKNISDMANQNGAEVFYIRINIDSEIAKERKRTRYEDPSWVSSFDDFRVNTTDKMLKNIDERAELHQKLKSSEIPNLLGEVNNDGSLEELKKQVEELVPKIKI